MCPAVFAEAADIAARRRSRSASAIDGSRRTTRGRYGARKDSSLGGMRFTMGGDLGWGAVFC